MVQPSADSSLRGDQGRDGLTLCFDYLVSIQHSFTSPHHSSDYLAQVRADTKYEIAVYPPGLIMDLTQDWSNGMVGTSFPCLFTLTVSYPLPLSFPASLVRNISFRFCWQFFSAVAVVPHDLYIFSLALLLYQHGAVKPTSHGFPASNLHSRTHLSMKYPPATTIRTKAHMLSSVDSYNFELLLPCPSC
jgi:hypothetical protein